MKLLENINLDVGLFVVQWTRMADNLIYCRITLQPESAWNYNMLGVARCSSEGVFNQRIGMWLSLKRCIALYKNSEPEVYNFEYRKYIWERFHQYVRMKNLSYCSGYTQKFKKIPEAKMPGVTYFYDGENYMVKEIALFKGTKKDPKKWKKVVIYTDYASKFINTYVRDFSTFTSKYRPCPPKDQKMPL